MVAEFNPTQLRLELLRRLATYHETGAGGGFGFPSEAAPAGSRDEPGVLSRCMSELRDWFVETPPVRLCRGLRGPRPSSSSSSSSAVEASSTTSDVGADATLGTAAGNVDANVESEGAATATALSGEAAAGASAAAASPGSEAASGIADANVSAAASVAAHAGSGAPPDSGAEAMIPRRPRGFPAKAICGHLRTAFQEALAQAKVLLFLEFPRHSPFLDPNVEELFLLHYSRRRSIFDWSTVVLFTMCAWDILVNPPYRMEMVILYYAAFAAALLLREVLILVVPLSPRRIRFTHNAFLSVFFLGRCLVCQPSPLIGAGDNHDPATGMMRVEAFSSVIGLGMTNLSMVFMQRMQTVDMLIFCAINGLVFVLWIVFVLQMPLTEAIHTAYVGSIVVTAVCVRQQRDLEDLERRSFDQELIHTRGTLVRTADRISQQASGPEFALGMRILQRVRRVEHTSF
eukprot:TRINITY_DN8120_c0_g1_i1.p1 TRINITY_DN8120_c0_g1~~TRINITY_DN8120_c0_g1_i1.p1  ORF type:complete len:459 (-),score=81.14 TRINITY_DN8120_c0_g1_i1:2-1378(-)